jgi:hypothetical protein
MAITGGGAAGGVGDSGRGTGRGLNWMKAVTAAIPITTLVNCAAARR